MPNKLKSLQSNDFLGFEPSREEVLDHHNLGAGVEHGLETKRAHHEARASGRWINHQRIEIQRHLKRAAQHVGK